MLHYTFSRNCSWDFFLFSNRTQWTLGLWWPINLAAQSWPIPTAWPYACPCPRSRGPLCRLLLHLHSFRQLLRHWLLPVFPVFFSMFFFSWVGKMCVCRRWRQLQIFCNFPVLLVGHFSYPSSLCAAACSSFGTCFAFRLGEGLSYLCLPVCLFPLTSTSAGRAAGWLVG